MGALFFSVFEVRPCRPDFPNPQSKPCSALENMSIREKLHRKATASPSLAPAMHPIRRAAVELL